MESLVRLGRVHTVGNFLLHHRIVSKHAAVKNSPRFKPDLPQRMFDTINIKDHARRGTVLRPDRTGLPNLGVCTIQQKSRTKPTGVLTIQKGIAIQCNIIINKMLQAVVFCVMITIPPVNL